VSSQVRQIGASSPASKWSTRRVAGSATGLTAVPSR
jgi:hypothetical protein